MEEVKKAISELKLLKMQIKRGIANPQIVENIDHVIMILKKED